MYNVASDLYVIVVNVFVQVAYICMYVLKYTMRLKL